MTTQLQTQLTAAGLDAAQLTGDQAEIFATMSADELKAFAQAQQADDQPEAKSGSMFAFLGFF